MPPVILKFYFMNDESEIVGMFTKKKSRNGKQVLIQWDTEMQYRHGQSRTIHTS